MLTSINNKLIKSALELYEKKARETTNLFLIEGLAELSVALKHKIEFKNIFYCSSLLSSEAKNILSRISAEQIEVDEKVYERLAYRGTTGGILAVARQPQTKLSDLVLPDKSLVLVIEEIEKPGNVGAMLRTAEAAGVQAVVLCSGPTDLYNPNIVRASLGAIFALPVAEAKNPEVLTWLQKNKFKIIATTPAAQKKYTAVSLAANTAILVGSEKDGLTEFWLKNADEKVLIPMQGEVNSLNASVSAAILIYEAVRQRGTHP